MINEIMDKNYLTKNQLDQYINLANLTQINWTCPVFLTNVLTNFSLIQLNWTCPELGTAQPQLVSSSVIDEYITFPTYYGSRTNTYISCNKLTTNSWAKDAHCTKILLHKPYRSFIVTNFLNKTLEIMWYKFNLPSI